MHRAACRRDNRLRALEKPDMARLILLMLLLSGMASATLADPPESPDTPDTPDTPTTMREAFPNGGFESGLDTWSLHLADDHAVIDVVADPSATDGDHVLSIKHDRMRMSYVTCDVQLEPFESYLCTFEVRTGDAYLRGGIGAMLQVYAEGIAVSTWRQDEAHLSQQWQTIRMPFVTGESGRVQLIFYLRDAAGKVRFDNVRLQQRSREQLVQVLGSTYPSPIPRVPIEDGIAAANVWYDEMPVSLRLPSEITIDFRETLSDELWATRRLILELPPEVRVLRPEGIAGEPTEGGRVRYTFPAEHIVDVGGGWWWCMMLFQLDKPMAGPQSARFFAQWNGGEQEPVTVPVLTQDVGVYRQPRHIITGTQNSSPLGKYMGDEYPAMYQSLGFNHVTYWQRGAGKELIDNFHAHHIKMETAYSGLYEYIPLVQELEDAWGTQPDGTRVAVINPAHRGEIYEKFQADIASHVTAGFDGVEIDDEYFVDWRGMNLDFSDETCELWKQWLAANRPDLKYVQPQIVYDDPLNHREHFDAWWLFRASLMKAWYAEARQRSLEHAEANGDAAKATWMTLAVGRPAFATMKTDLYNYRDLFDVFTYFSPQLYMDAHDIRTETRDLVAAVGRDRAVPLLCMGESRADRFEWQPGEIRAQILEVLFAGAHGYNSWGWYYSNQRIINEMARTNDVIAQHEDVFVNGVATDTFLAVNQPPRQFATTLETDDAGLLLVSNYTRGADRIVRVRRQPGEPLVLTHCFTGKCMNIEPGQEVIHFNITPGTCGLWRWDKQEGN
jgi:hypothetical protein